MHAEMLIERSPMRAVATSIRGGLETGQVGAVLARAGVGKSAFLVHVALNSLLRGVEVLHVSLTDGQSRVRSYYDEILSELAAASPGGDRAAAEASIERHRVIHASRGRDFGAAELSHLLSTLEDVMHFHPVVVIIDGLDNHSVGAESVDAWRQVAVEGSLRLWLGIRTHRDGTGAEPDTIVEHVDTAVVLDPEGSNVVLRIPRVGGRDNDQAQALNLDPVTMMVHPDDLTDHTTAPPSPHPSMITLYSGGATGAEAAFGEQAAAWGMGEVNFTFDGHTQLRTRGRKVLDTRELAAGDVSMLYVAHKLRRNWDKTELLKKVLQTQWHIVSNANQVFVVGVIQEDGTVRGGTGWSVELARRWRKPVWVFDQVKETWNTWNGETWIQGDPVIQSTTVAGTGTRFLNDAGRAAIEKLFKRSFGA